VTTSDSNKIFVQIPAYRDSQLVPTIESLFENAYNPDRLNLHICWQRELKETLPASVRNRRNTNVIDVDYRKSRGAGWARSLLQKFWSGEPYSLLVDSHTRFRKNWDKRLLHMMKQLKVKGIEKPVISCLPPSFYDPDQFPSQRDTYPTKIYPKEYSENLLIRFQGISIPLFRWLKEPIPADFIAMGFLFTEGSFNREIKYDPFIYFFGDDITTAARAYSYGYRFFHPHEVVAWRLYNRDTRIPHWDDHEDWIAVNKAAYERISRILRGESVDEYSTFGSSEAIKGYEEYTGYKFILNDHN